MAEANGVKVLLPPDGAVDDGGGGGGGGGGTQFVGYCADGNIMGEPRSVDGPDAVADIVIDEVPRVVCCIKLSDVA